MLSPARVAVVMTVLALFVQPCGGHRRLVQPDSPVSALAPPGVVYSGFDRFPALYFGAAENGAPQSATTLDFVHRHAMAGWGWQQGYRPNADNGEAMGAAAASALAQHSAPGMSPDMLFYTDRYGHVCVLFVPCKSPMCVEGLGHGVACGGRGGRDEHQP